MNPQEVAYSRRPAPVRLHAVELQIRAKDALMNNLRSCWKKNNTWPFYRSYTLRVLGY